MQSTHRDLYLKRPKESVGPCVETSSERDRGERSASTCVVKERTKRGQTDRKLDRKLYREYRGRVYTSMEY